MKIRNGYVSNSSSSSFIIGIAKIIDLEKMRKYLSDMGISSGGYEFTIISKYDLEQNKPYDVNMRNNKISLEAFTGADVSLDSIDMKGLDIMLLYDYTGHGDSDFQGDEMYYDLDYDIDSDFFDKSEQKVFKMFNDEDSGLDIKTANITFGAGRNG